MVESGLKTKVTFQAADVRKPLLAVSSLVDKGNVGFFDGDSYILPYTAPELELIRDLVAQIKNKIPLYRERGVYKMRNWAPATFPRQGK